MTNETHADGQRDIICDPCRRYQHVDCVGYFLVERDPEQEAVAASAIRREPVPCACQAPHPNGHHRHAAVVKLAR